MELDESTVAPQAINTSGAGSTSGTMSDWFALPLDQFFNSSTAGVDQGLGGTGPMVGEFDMLEVLLKDPYTTDGGAGANETGGSGTATGTGTGNNRSGGTGGGGAGGSGGVGSGANGTGLPSQYL